MQISLLRQMQAYMVLELCCLRLELMDSFIPSHMRVVHCRHTRSCIVSQSWRLVWAVTHFHAYLYGHNVQVLTDHSAVRAVLESPSPTAKHARWWSKVFGSGIKNITIKYRPGKENSNADALSCCPHSDAPSTPMVTDAHIAGIQSEDTDISQLLQCPPGTSSSHDFAIEQDQDPNISSIC